MRFPRVSRFSLIILSSLGLVCDLAVAQSPNANETSSTDSSETANSETANSETTNNSTLPPARFLFSTRYAAGTVAGFVVDPTTGQLYDTGQTPVWAHWGPTRIAANVGATQLFVANQGSMDVSAYTIDRATGYLTPAPGANFKVAGVSSDIAVHPSNKFVYVTTAKNWDGVQGGQNSICVFSIDSDGSLKAVPGSPFLTTYNNAALAITPDGKFLYTASNTDTGGYDGVLNAYSIDQTTGAITELAGWPHKIVPAKCKYCFNWDEFYDLAMDPQGKFLFAPGWVNGVIYVYSINSTSGNLQNVSGSPFVDLEPGNGVPGAMPYSITLDAKGRFVYVENGGVGEITGYTLNRTTGTLTNVKQTPLPYSAFFYMPNIRSDPSGKFVYLLGLDTANKPPNDGAIDGLVINPSNASLSQAPSAPYANPGGDDQAQVDGIVVTP